MQNRFIPLQYAITFHKKGFPLEATLSRFSDVGNQRKSEA